MKRGLKAKIKEHLKAKEAGKREYHRADELLNELIKEMKPGVDVVLGEGRRARLKDNFEDGNTAFRAHGIKRFEIEVEE